ncbi:MAG: hypothetical protein CBC25_04825 [Pelagibacteraceae bacterium TMED65]|nr:MAG: hypothetical protein CBC25_04825 [Pelagibacteraceae bacterium TMED65]
MLIYNLFKKRFKNNKDKIIFFENSEYDYLELLKLVNLAEAYVNKNNDNISIICENNIYHIVLYLLSSKLNKKFIPLDPGSPVKDLLKTIRIYKIKNIFCNDKISAILKKKNIKNTNINKIKKINRKKIIKNVSSKIFLLSFTSGSTGNPKPIALSQKIKLLRAKSNIKLYSLSNIEKILISTPLYHTLAIRLLNIFILTGGKIFVIEKYNFEKLVNIIKKQKIEFTFFISDQINQLIRNKKFIYHLKSLKNLVSSSSTLSLQNKKIIINYFGNKFHECYGLSEGAILTSLSLKNRSHFGSVGKTIPGVKIKIKNKKKKIGEILFKSSQMFLGYLNRQGRVNKSIDKSGYFNTGDLGYFIKNYLYFTGRKKNMIKVKGKSIYPEDIEKILLQSKLIKDCAIASIKNKDFEEQLCVAYVLKNPKVSDSKIKNYCFNSLSSFHLPRFFLKINKIPRNNLGKINRVKLNKVVIEKLNV